MRASKFSMGGLIGVHISSVVNKVIRKMTFFFLRINLERIKTQIEPKPTNKIKLSEQRTTKATFFRAEKPLRERKLFILRFLKRTEIVLITSYTTSYVITQLSFVLIVFLVFSFLQY